MESVRLVRWAWLSKDTPMHHRETAEQFLSPRCAVLVNCSVTYMLLLVLYRERAGHVPDIPHGLFLGNPEHPLIAIAAYE